MEAGPGLAKAEGKVEYGRRFGGGADCGRGGPAE